jgi:hypothetical protein
MTSTVVPSIGEPVVRIDGWVKASGAPIFPSDFVVEGMLWLRVLRAHQSHARILSIDTSLAEQVDGVLGVFTAQDVPGSNRVGSVFQDMPVLCEDKVRYRGIAFFEKLGPRKAQTIAIASVALRGWLSRGQGQLMDVRVALGAVAPTVMSASRTAEYLMDGPLMEERILEAGEIAAQECQPIDDVRGSAVYRRRLVRGLLVRGLWPYAGDSKRFFQELEFG